VLLRVLVSAAGHAQHVEVARSSGSPRLDDAAVEAVRRWRFVPAKRGSEAIAASVHVPIVFSLRG
jgi:protein TonB